MKIINDSGQILELDNQSAITVDRFNSLFNEPDKLVQEYIYNGKCGLTENNKIFIGNGQLIESDNSVYTLQITMIIHGSNFFKGNMVYKIVDDQIDYSLQVNLGALVTRMKNTRLPEIRTEDGIYVPNLVADPTHNIGNIEVMRERMTQSCLYPQKYPYAYFPVQNELYLVKRSSSGDWPLTNFVNYWKHADQIFVCASGYEYPDPGIGWTVHSPFFKFTYILKKVFEYLGLAVTGDVFTDPELDKIYIYTRRTNMYREDFAGLDPSMTYMPNMTVLEFIKQSRERLRLMIDIDTLNSVARVRTSKNILADPDYLDLSEYVESLQEFGEPDKKGYRVFLKPDDQDDLFTSAEGSDKQPDYRVIIGDGTTDIPIMASTLKKSGEADYHFPATKQRTTFYFFPAAQPEEGDNALLPSDPNDPTTINNWPLRLLKYSGMKDVAGGKKFPEALPYDLDESDAEWYQFRNDSKAFVAILNLPVNVLEQLGRNPKIGLISKEGLKFQALYEKYSYTVMNTSSELIKVKIEGYTLITDLKTTVKIEKVEHDPVIENTTINCVVKAFFDSSNPLMKQIEISAIPMTPGAAEFSGGTIVESTDAGGAGGGRVAIRSISGEKRTGVILQVKYPPQYLYNNGRRILFTKVGDFWQVSIPYRYNNAHQSFWIVF